MTRKIASLPLLVAVALLGLLGTAAADPIAYITNFQSNTVSVIHTATNSVVAEVQVGAHPAGVAVHPNGTRVYIANSGENFISVIDTATNTVTDTVSVLPSTNPFAVAVNPAGTRLYVANVGGRGLSVIDPVRIGTAEDPVIASVSVGSNPHGVAVHPAGTRVYVADQGAPNLAVIDAATNTLLASVPVAERSMGVAVHPDGTQVFVANWLGNTVSVINTLSNTMTTTVLVGNSPCGITVNRAGTRVYVANQGDSTVSVIDPARIGTAENPVVATVPVGSAPCGVAVTPDGARVYVANVGGNTVSVIDTATNTPISSVTPPVPIPVGVQPFALGEFIAPARLGPSISSISPSSGPVGSLVTITGQNFGATQGSSVVKFGSFTAGVRFWSDTQIRATVPSEASPMIYGVTVATAQGSILAVFTITAPPSGQPVGTVTDIPILSSMQGIALEPGGSTLLINHVDRISRFDLSTGLVQTTITLPHTISERFLIEPSGNTVLAFDFVADVVCRSGRLVRVSLLTGEITPIATGLSCGPAGLALEGSGTTVLVTQVEDPFFGARVGTLSRVDLATGAVTPIARDLGFVGDVAPEPGGQTALVASCLHPPSFFFPCTNVLFRVDLQTGAASPIFSTGDSINGQSIRRVAVEAGGASAIVAATFALHRIDLQTGAATQIFVGSVTDLALEPNGTTALLTAFSEGLPVLLRVDLTTSQSSQILAFAISPEWVVPDPSAPTTAFVSSGGVFRVNLETGRAEFFARFGQVQVGQLAIEPSGRTGVFAFRDTFGPRGGVARLDLVTGAVSVIFQAGFEGFIPVGLAIEPSGLTALVTDINLGQTNLWRVNLADGSKSLVTSGFTHGSIGGVAVHPDGQTAFVAEPASGVLDRVDLSTGGVTNLFVFGVGGPDGIVIEPGGATALFTAIIFPGAVSGVFRVNLTSGEVALVTQLPSRGGAVALEAGGRTALVAGFNRLFRVVVGEVLPPPAPVLSVPGGPLDFTSVFGAVNVGTSQDLTFTIQNTGGGTLTGTVSTGGAFTIGSGNSIELAPGESLTVTVRFTPDGPGDFAGNVNIESNGGSRSILIIGKGVGLPSVSSISPSSGPVGSLVTITGQNFGATQGSSVVKFGSFTAGVRFWSDTQIRATVPSEASPMIYDVTVTTAQGTSNAVKFTITAPPSGQPVGTVVDLPILPPMTGIALEQGGSTLLANHADRISRVDLATGVVTAVINPAHPIHERILVIEASGTSVLTFDFAGAPNCFFPCGRLVRVDLASGEITPIATGLSGAVSGLALEAGGTTVLVAQVEDFFGDRIGTLSRVDLGTGAVTPIARDLGFVGDVAPEPGGLTALVASCFHPPSFFFPCTNVLFRVDLQTGAASPVFFPGDGIQRVVVEAGGASALVIAGCCEGQGTQYYRVSLATGAATLLLTDIPAAGHDIALESNGTTALLARSGVFHTLERVDVTAFQSAQILAYAITPTWVTPDPSGTNAFVSSGSSIFRVNLETGRADPFAQFPQSFAPQQLAIEASGGTGIVTFQDNRFCFCQQGGVARLDLVTGAVSVIFQPPQPATPPFAPFGLAIEPSGLTALVTDGWEGVSPHQLLWRVNLLSGAATVIASGLNFIGLKGVAVTADGQTAFLTVGQAISGSMNPGIYRVDLTTGVVTPLVLASTDRTDRPVGNIVIEPAGTTALFVTQGNGNRLFRMNLTSGGLALLAQFPLLNTSGALGISLEAGGATALVAWGNRLFRVVIGEAVPPPQPVLSLTSTSLDFTPVFGPVPVGTSQELGFTIQNTGGDTLSGTLNVGGCFSIISGSSFSLTAGQTQTVMVRFSPAGSGICASNVLIQSNGGNASVLIMGEGNQPPALSLAGQFYADGITAIPEGGASGESTVVFKATIVDPEGDQVRLEIELRQITEPFTGVATPETISAVVPSGTEITITRGGLVPAQYHWRARAVDNRGAAGPWVEFGIAGNIDFKVAGGSINLGAPAGSGTASEPVNTATGNYFFQRTDLVIPGRGLPLLFTRTYNTLDSYSGPLGSGWTHSYNVVLTEKPDGSVVIKQGDGREEFYDPAAAGSYTPRFGGVFNILVKNPGGTFSLMLKNQTQYRFSAAGKLASIVDRNGNALAFAYDGAGNLSTITDTVGRAILLAYDASNRLIQLSDPIGRRVRYGYDAGGNLASVTDPRSGVMTFAYDASHRVTEIRNERGNRLLLNTYDGSSRVATQQNGLGFTTTFAYATPVSGDTTITDPRGNATVHTHDAQFRLTKVTDGNGNTVNFGYDTSNNRTSITDQNGKTTLLTYDARGNVTSITDPLGHMIAFAYDLQNNFTSATNARGFTTAFGYDARGNLAEIKDAVGNVTGLGYDSFGQLIRKTDARGNVTQYGYDSQGNVTRINDAGGGVTILGYDGIGRLLSLTDPNGHTATADYDASSRLTKIMDPLGNSTRFTFDGVGNLAEIVDAKGNRTGYSYDEVNNLTTVADALGSITSYSYDANNSRTALINANGRTTTYTFDGVNRLSRIIDPLGNATAYTYDPVGNVRTVTDANGTTNTFGYDANNRLIGITYGDGASVTYTYDPNGNRASMVDARGTTTYSYDVLDRLVEVAQPTGRVSYGYDSVGNRTTLTYPDGRTITYTYDFPNRLSEVVDFHGRVTSYSYDPASNLLAVSYPNGTGMAYQYDAANRLVSVVNSRGGQVMSRYEYQLDQVGNRTAMMRNGQVTGYSYDALSQLVATVDPGGNRTEYRYDPAGNMTAYVVRGQAIPLIYDAADQLLQADSWTYEYDRNGNRIRMSRSGIITEYAYDASNRLVRVERSGRVATHEYDGDGNKVAQTLDGAVTRVIPDVATALPVVLAEAGPGGDFSYVYGLSLIEQSGPLLEHFYHHDGLGSVVNLTDSMGNVTATYTYDPWGRPQQGAFLRTPNRFLFTGEERDAGTGLYYLRARWYDPSVGRFLTRDPLPGSVAAPRTTNRYAYALNNPSTFLDRNGLEASSSVGFTILVGALERQALHGGIEWLTQELVGFGARRFAMWNLLREFPTTELVTVGTQVTTIGAQAGHVGVLFGALGGVAVAPAWHLIEDRLQSPQRDPVETALRFVVDATFSSGLSLLPGPVGFAAGVGYDVYREDVQRFAASNPVAHWGGEFLFRNLGGTRLGRWLGM